MNEIEYKKERNIDCEYEYGNDHKIMVIGNSQKTRERYIRELTICDFITYIKIKEIEKFDIHTQNGDIIIGDNLRYNDELQYIIVYKNNSLIAFLKIYSIAVIDFLRSD